MERHSFYISFLDEDLVIISKIARANYRELKRQIEFIVHEYAAQHRVQPTVESGRELPAEVVNVESVLPASSG